jgi:hypothetical protein
MLRGPRQRHRYPAHLVDRHHVDRGVPETTAPSRAPIPKLSGWLDRALPVQSTLGGVTRCARSRFV